MRLLAVLGGALAFVATVPVTTVAQMEACRLDSFSSADPKEVVPFRAVNLDLPPQERWLEVISEKSANIQEIVDYLFGMLPKWLSPKVRAFLDQDLSPLCQELGDPGLEMIGVSKASGVDLGRIVAMNIMYEAFTVCTSVVAETSGGDIVHARNLDFGLFMGRDHKNHTWELTNLLRPLLVNVNFTRSGSTVFQATHYAGYVGVLTGMSDKLSLTIDDRFDINGGFAGIIDWFKGDRKQRWVSLLAREVLESGYTYDDAIAALKAEPIIAPVYYIVGGTESGQGAVVSRGRNESLIFRDIDSSTPPGEGNARFPGIESKKYVLETNYDWDKPAPFYDARRPAALKCLGEIPDGQVSLESLYGVLTTKPVLNELTTYTILMSAKSGRYEVWKRYCRDDAASPYPCSLW